MGFANNSKKNLYNVVEFTCIVCGQKGKVNDVDTKICNGPNHNQSVYVHGKCFNDRYGQCDNCREGV